MIVVGINVGSTIDGQTLDNGGCCIIKDGKIKVAVAEERVSRKKYDGGFSKSLQYCLDYCKIKPADVDLFVVSSCCEEQLPDGVDIGLNVPKEKIITVSHHTSHAYSAFMVSPFDKAIIMVLDNEGNIIGERRDKEYWKNRLERSSFYLGEGNKIELIERDMDEANIVGFGEAYRDFVHFLGWPSYIHAEKVMGLASYGRFGSYSNVEIFNCKDGKVSCRLRNNHLKPSQEIRRFGKKEYNVDFGPPREPFIGEINQKHKDVAFLIQDRLEKALIYKVNHLYEKTGIENICIAGGVGLNCVANGKIIEETQIKNIFIQPAASDQGQCLGNALYGYHCIFKHPRKIKMKNAYLGKKHSDREIRRAISLYKDKLIVKKVQNMPKEIARMLSEEKIIAFFHDKSEFGPRALGHRSIITDPRSLSMKDRLNKKVKFREEFRPYAPSVLKEHVKSYFEFDGDSPFMLLAVKVRKNKQKLIPAVVHVDGTSRIQTVTKQQNGIYYDIINEFRKITGIPMVLNTSFNLGGEPIVESPEDAIKCFLSTQIDCLVIENNLIKRKNNLT